MSMVVKPGYKQTEVGVVPEDWAVSTFQQVTDIITCGLAATPTYVSESVGKPFLSAQNVRKGRVVFNNHRFIPAVLFEQITRHNKPKRGDLLYTRVGAGIGEAGIVESDVEFGIYVSLTLIRTDLRKLQNGFAAHLLNSPCYRSRAKGGQFAGGGVQNLNVEVVRQFPIPLPSLEEQCAIAKALSDADALIESLEQLLAKKRQVKQGAMQKLLTGKKRLPGFSGEWEVKRLGELGSTFGGLTGKVKSDFGDGDSRFITFMNIMTNVVIDSSTFERVKVSPTESQNRVMKGDLFFNGSSETPEEVGMCAVLTQEVQDVFLNSFCFGFRFRIEAEADGLFLAYYFRSREGRELLKSLAQGATRYNLSKTALLKVTFSIPSLPEQTAIAAVLSDMDAEIESIETKLAKSRQIKQGMMQELLTGKTRLI